MNAKKTTKKTEVKIVIVPIQALSQFTPILKYIYYSSMAF